MMGSYSVELTSGGKGAGGLESMSIDGSQTFFAGDTVRLGACLAILPN